MQQTSYKETVTSNHQATRCSYTVQMDLEIHLPSKAQILLLGPFARQTQHQKKLMARKNFYVESKYYVLCEEQIEESITYLFFSCDFSQTFWWKIGEEWNLDFDLIEMITDANDRSTNQFLKNHDLCLLKPMESKK
jgi:hypothetical protein